MTRRFLRKLFRPASSRIIGLPFVFGTVGVVMGLVGLAIHEPELTPRSVAGITFRVLRSFVPYVDSLGYGNWINQTGAVFAVMATMTGTLLVALAVLGETFTKYFTRALRSGHTVVIGDTPLADRLALALDEHGTKVIHAVPHGAAKAAEDAPRRLHFDFTASSLISALALRRAGVVIVDLGNGAATASMGFAMLTQFDRAAAERGLWAALSRTGRHRQPGTLALCVADSALADQFSEMLEAARAALPSRTKDEPPYLKPVFLNPNHSLARSTLARYPLFAIAARRGQSHVHAVIVGFGDLGEKLLDQVMLTSLARDLGTPRITVLDREAVSLERRFRARRPRVLDELPIQFVSVNLGAEPLSGGALDQALSALRDAENDGGITAIYLALASDEETVAAALLLKRHRDLTGQFTAPVFYRSRSADAVAILPSEAPGEDPASGFVRLQVDDKALLREIFDPETGRALARSLHEAYLAGGGEGQPWDELSDTHLRANVRAADHLPAKLWSLGVDVSGLKPGSLPVLSADVRERIGVGEDLTPEVRRELMPLARLEHERWSIERRLDGWTYGPKRDKSRRIHPLLVGWRTLVRRQGEADKNIEQFRAAITFAIRRSGG